MEVIVVGAGRVGRTLLRRLSPSRWDVVVVDPDPGGLAAAGQIRPIRSLLGCGTDPQVMAAAGLSPGAVVVAATGDDDVNLSVARMARGAGASCVAVAGDPERLPEYRSLDVPASSPDRLVARRVVSLLEPRRVFSAGFAGGRAEGLDFRIVAQSPVCGMALRDLPAERWLVVAVLRGDELIIPHGDTVLEEDDVVTVVGAGADLGAMVGTFAAGVARFPREFGRRVVVPLRSHEDAEGPLAEAIHVARISHAAGVTVLHRDPSGLPGGDRSRLEELVDRALDAGGDVDVEAKPVAGDPQRRLLEGEVDVEVGLIVVAPPSRAWLRWRFPVAGLLNAVVRLQRPLLVARNSHPYRRVVLPARDTPSGHAAAGTAVDLATYDAARVLAVAVVPPLFMAGDEAREDALRTVSHLQEEAALQGVKVRSVVREGNEVRVLSGFAGPGSLFVVGMRRRTATPLTPGVAGFLLSRLPSSVLVVPHRQRR